MVWSSTSSSLAVAHIWSSHAGLCDSNSHKLIALYTEHSPLVAESRSTPSIISLGLASSAALSSLFSNPCCVDSHCSAFLVLSLEQAVLHEPNVQCGNIASRTNRAECIYGIRTYQTYLHIYIHIYRQFSVFTTSVGLAALTPITDPSCYKHPHMHNRVYFLYQSCITVVRCYIIKYCIKHLGLQTAHYV